MTLGGYKQRCAECDDSYSRAASFCPYCGTPSGVEFELGIGAVLYEDRPDTPDDERRLHHVTDRRVSLEDGDVYYVIEDGTHTRRYHYHAEDVLADFAPAGWQWPTGRKPTYWLTRHCDVADEMDLMTDGGVDQSTGGGKQVALSRNPDEWEVAQLARDGRKAMCPDCRSHVGHTKSGGKPLPDTEVGAFGWSCPDCKLTFPSNCDGPTAPGFNSSMAGLQVDFRDGKTRWVPIPARYVDTDTDRSGGGSR